MNKKRFSYGYLCRFKKFYSANKRHGNMYLNIDSSHINSFVFCFNQCTRPVHEKKCVIFHNECLCVKYVHFNYILSKYALYTQFKRNYIIVELCHFCSDLQVQNIRLYTLILVHLWLVLYSAMYKIKPLVND
jgi:hypothetical protein